jgi:protein-tyrosine phosphatase
VIDLHCHVLPGIDDGPPDLAGSIALAAEAARQGVTVLAATPHARPDHPRVDVAQIGRMCEELAARLPAEPAIQIVPAAEVDLLWAQRATEDELVLASFGQRGTDLLVETPYGELPGNFEDLLFSISARGFRVLLAHPERNPSFQTDHSRVSALVERGVLLQVTAPALLAERRSRSRRFALALIELGLAHVLSSDAHAAEHFRPPLLAEAVAMVAQRDPDRARWMVEDAPAAVLSGEPLPSAPALPARNWAPRLRHWTSRG